MREMATFSSTTSEMAACATDTGAAELPEILLTPGDIDGAVLELPFERHTKHALRFWLLCRGITLPSSSTKALLVAR